MIRARAQGTQGETIVNKLVRLCLVAVVTASMGLCESVPLSGAVVPVATIKAKWKNNVTLLPSNTDKVVVPLDGTKRKVQVTCDSMEGDACSSLGLRVNSRLVLTTLVAEMSLVTAKQRVIRFPKKKGLVLVSVEKYSIADDHSFQTEATSSAALYRYLKGRMVLVRDLWKDHRTLAATHDPAYSDGDGRLSTRSYVSKVAASGSHFTVTWATVDWSCTNVHPKVVYKYSKGRVSVVSHTSVGACA